LASVVAKLNTCSGIDFPLLGIVVDKVYHFGIHHNFPFWLWFRQSKLTEHMAPLDQFLGQIDIKDVFFATQIRAGKEGVLVNVPVAAQHTVVKYAEFVRERMRNKAQFDIKTLEIGNVRIDFGQNDIKTTCDSTASMLSLVQSRPYFEFVATGTWMEKPMVDQGKFSVQIEFEDPNKTSFSIPFQHHTLLWNVIRRCNRVAGEGYLYWKQGRQYLDHLKRNFEFPGAVPICLRLDSKRQPLQQHEYVVDNKQRGTVFRFS
jgi:hypothetical protein